jgi:PPOX class probable F420-dependent enzyme
MFHEFDHSQTRIAELVGRDRDPSLSTELASVICAAERLGTREIAGLDRRHFVVRSVTATHARLKRVRPILRPSARVPVRMVAERSASTRIASSGSVPGSATSNLASYARSGLGGQQFRSAAPESSAVCPPTTTSNTPVTTHTPGRFAVIRDVAGAAGRGRTCEVTADLDLVRRLVRADHGLAVVATTRSDGTVHGSLVNAGVLEDPITYRPVLGFVTAGSALKLRLLRRSGRATVVLRAGWEWVAVEGPVRLLGPDDTAEGFTMDRLPTLLRDVFTAAGGTHDDWREYDRVMAAERRAAVLVHPERLTSNA